MSDLEGRAMIKDMKELEDDYRILLDEYLKYPKLDASLRVNHVLEELRYAGRYISRPQYREKLADWCRNLGRIVYSLTGDFPTMRIFPFEIRDALTAARENRDLNERVEDMVWIASYLPKEEKQALIEDAYKIATTITCEEDRAKALRAISNSFPAEKIFIPHQIPPPPYDFTGRESDLRELLAYFEKGVSIIGLRGMGGIGKKTLAFALAERLKDRFTDGQLLVDMRGTDSEPLKPTDAMAQIIRSYRPNEKIPDSQAELANLYRSVLNGKCALLLLINATDETQVRPLLPPANCSLIVTSRRKFILPGMVTKDLDVLRINEAVELLFKLASSGSSDNALLKDEAWQELALLCGCLPVALRAAGSYLVNSPDTSLERYAEGLKDERTRLNRIGGEVVDASINLSFQRLDPETKQTFFNASVFPADFDGQAEEQICQDERHKHLSELVRWSIVDYQPHGPDYGRYKLHDLVRLFASSKQPAELKAIVQERHAAYYKDLLSSANDLYLKGGLNIQAGLDLFDRDWPNIRAGQAWAENNQKTNPSAAELCKSYPAAGAYVIDLRLNPQQKITWIETALSAARQLKDRNMEGMHLGNLGRTYAALGDAKKAIEYYEQALAIAREIGDRMGEGADLGNLGSAYAALGDAKKAIEYYEQRLSIAREIGDRMGEGAGLGNLGNAYAALGDAKKAIEYYEQALTIVHEIGDRRGEGADLGNLGNAYAALGDAKKAIEYYEQALAIDREIGDRRGEGVDLGNLGNAHAALGDAKKAIEYYELALAIAREIGDRRGEGAWLGNMGLAYADLGETYTAIEFNMQNLAISREIGDRRGEGNSLGNLGLAYAALGDAKKAIEYYEQQIVITREIGDRMGEGNALGNLGNAYAALGDAQKAIEYYEQALKNTREIVDRRAEGAIMGNLGNAHAALGEISKALDYYEQQLKIAQEIGDRYGAGNSLWGQAICHEKNNDIAQAMGKAEKALKIFEQIESPSASNMRELLSKWRSK